MKSSRITPSARSNWLTSRPKTTSSDMKTASAVTKSIIGISRVITTLVMGSGRSSAAHPTMRPMLAIFEPKMLPKEMPV